MNILFLCCAYSEMQKVFFLNSSKRGYQHAAQNLQEAIIDGFIKNEVLLTVLSIPSLSTYPKGCKIPFVKDSPFVYNGEECGASFGYANIPFLNHVNKNKASSFVDEWYYNAKGKKIIVVYALLAQQMSIAVAAKHRHPDLKLCIVVPDLPRYMACNKYYKKLGLQKKAQIRIDTMVPDFDCFVVLAKNMVDDMQVSGRPYVVVEGIYNKIGDEKVEGIEKYQEKTVLYTGGIQTRYGVFDLINAFSRIDGDNYKLILCGPCPEMDKLNDCLKKDKRISYWGLLPTEEARKLQKKATLLVNPRHSGEMFTRYSFPSKTLEYMASGTPVLMCHLESLPDDYLKYIYLFGDESIEGMTQTMSLVLNYEQSVLQDLGKRAYHFITEQKNAKVQTAKIISLLESIQYR